MNPFLSIWTRPSETIHYVLNHKTLTYSFLIIVLSVIAAAPFTVSQFLFMEDFPIFGVIVLALIFLFTASVAGWMINAALYTWIGKWLGGKGNYREMIQVVPLGSLPSVWLLPLSLIMTIAFSVIRFNESEAGMSVIMIVVILGPLLSLLLFGLSIYGMVILSKAIGIVHQFSAWKGLGTIAIILGIIFLLLFICMIVFFFFAFMLLPS